jgi:hypothetical protein
MLTLLEYLQNLTEEEIQNTHLEHIEDMIYNEGVVGTRKAIEFLKDLRDTLVHKSDKIVTTTKWDGSPAVFCGIDPSDNKFFVAKKGLFNKTPKVYKSVQEVYADTEGDLAEKLAIAFTEFQHIGIKKGVVQGDLMFTKADIKKQTIDGKDYITFHPNTIVYAVPADSEVAKKITRAKIGVVWHTVYAGDSLKNFKVVGRANVADYKQNSNVWMIDATYRDLTKSTTLNDQEKKNLNILLSRIGRIFRTIPAVVINQVQNNELLKINIKAFNNSMIRSGKIISKNNYAASYKNYIIDKYNSKIEKLKSDRAKASAIKERDMLISYVQNNLAADINNVYLLMRYLAAAKQIVINKLNNISSVRTFLKTTNGFRVTGPEGFVVINQSGNMVKLVDRLEFSMANFSPNILKGFNTRN